MNKKQIEMFAGLIMALFVLSVPFMVSYSERVAYKKGLLDGANSEREMIELAIANGATTNRTCQELQSPFYANASYITCKVTWHYLPNPKNVTEQRQRYGLK